MPSIWGYGITSYLWRSVEHGNWALASLLLRTRYLVERGWIVRWRYESCRRFLFLFLFLSSLLLSSSTRRRFYPQRLFWTRQTCRPLYLQNCGIMNVHSLYITYTWYIIVYIYSVYQVHIYNIYTWYI